MLDESHEFLNTEPPDIAVGPTCLEEEVNSPVDDDTDSLASEPSVLRE